MDGETVQLSLEALYQSLLRDLYATLRTHESKLTHEDPSGTLAYIVASLQSWHDGALELHQRLETYQPRTLNDIRNSELGSLTRELFEEFQRLLRAVNGHLNRPVTSKNVGALLGCQLY